MQKVRSVILLMKALKNMDLQESTKSRVYSIILDTKKKYGEEAAEQKAAELIEIVDSCQTEEELLQKLDKFETP